MDAGETPAETALREGFEETGVAVASTSKLGDVRYVYTWEGERVFKVVSFFLARAERRSDRRAAAGMELEVAEARWLPLDEGPPLLAYKGEREMAARARREARERPSIVARPPMPTFALNFYNPAVAEQLRTGRKTATIRLGDKSAKYRKGMIVTVLCGARYGQRERIFDAVIDKVEVKALRELSPREIEHDNPQIRRVDELARFLSQLYNREIGEDDIVTLIRFSQITERRVSGDSPQVTPRTRMALRRSASSSASSTAAVACATVAGMASSSTPKSTAAQSRRSFQRRRIRFRARDPRPRAARRSAGSRAAGRAARRARGRPSASMPAGTAGGRCRSARSR